MVVIIRENDGTMHELKMKNGKWTLPYTPDRRVMRVMHSKDEFQEGDKVTVQYMTGKRCVRFMYGVVAKKM